jgi:hypothetical protein
LSFAWGIVSKQRFGISAQAILRLSYWNTYAVLAFYTDWQERRWMARRDRERTASDWMWLAHKDTWQWMHTTVQKSCRHPCPSHTPVDDEQRERESVQQATETDWLTGAHDSRWVQPSKTRLPSSMLVTYAGGYRAERESVQQATEANCLTRERDGRWSEPSKTTPPSCVNMTLIVWSIVKLIVTHLVKIRHLLQPNHSLLCSQETAAGIFIGPDESSYILVSYFFKV